MTKIILVLYIIAFGGFSATALTVNSSSSHKYLSDARSVFQNSSSCLSFVERKEEPPQDALYYDKDGKGVQNKALASYYRLIALSKDTNYPKRYKDYYISGDLRGEGGFISIDKYDDSRSIFDGECKTYSPNGQILESKTFREGVLDGVYSAYHESNGSVFKHVVFDKGKMIGTYSEFCEDGSASYTLDYVMGEPNSFYTLSTSDNNSAKYSVIDDAPIREQPQLSEKKIEYVDGIAWPYYLKNGMSVAMSLDDVSDYGKYYRVDFVIKNNSIAPVNVIAEDITAILINKKGKEKEANILSRKDYMKIVEGRQKRSMWWNASMESAAANSAAEKTITTVSEKTTDSVASEQGSKIGSNDADDGRKGLLGSKKENKTTSQTTTQTVTYDGAVAFHAKMIAEQRIAEYNNSLLQDRATKAEAYFKSTTLEPGEVVSGYVHIKFIKKRKGQRLDIVVPIGGVDYVFPWNLE